LQFVATMTGQSLPNVLKLFFSKKVTGKLEITAEKDFYAYVWFRDGNIIYATSSNTLSLKESVTILNLINDDVLEKLVSKVPDESILEDLLIKNNILQEKILIYIRSHQIAESLYSIVELEKANYELKDYDLKISREDLLPTTYNWLLEIYQNTYTWLQLIKRIPRNITNIKQGTIKEDKDFSKEEQKIYNLCDGKRKIRDIILWSSTTYFKAYTLMSGLLLKGFIKLEIDGSLMDSKIISEVTKILNNIEQMPGIKTAFLVDKTGKMIAKDSKRSETEESINTETMAKIFSTTVSNFESNLKSDSDEVLSQEELIEQLLVERANGDKTLLYVSGKVILVTEAFEDCDWGLLRLSAKRSMNSIKQLISMT